MFRQTLKAALLCIFVINILHSNTNYTNHICNKRFLSLRRIKTQVKLTPDQEQLKAILDSSDLEIEDTHLLVGDKLGDLLSIDEGYAFLYQQKASKLLVGIYEGILSGNRNRFPNHIWANRQGNINAGILTRYAIEQKEGWAIDENLPGKTPGWRNWLISSRLRGMLQGKFNDSTLTVLKSAYPEHFWDPDNWDKPFLWFDHDFHELVKWSSSECDHYTKQVIRYMIEQKEGWAIDENLPGKTPSWANWLVSSGLNGMFQGKFNSSPLAAFKFAYPEHFWDPDNWDKPFLWFDHDFSPQGIWQNSSEDHYAKQVIRYMVGQKEGWVVDELLPSKVKNEWFHRIGLGSMLNIKFSNSPLKAMRFAYTDEFKNNILREADFLRIVAGRGAAKVIHPPTSLVQNRKQIDSVIYHFGSKYAGYLASKISDDYGGLFDPEGILVNVFPLIKDPAISWMNVPNNGLLWAVPSDLSRFDYRMQQNLKLFPFSNQEVLEFLYYEFGIDPLALKTSEVTTLIAMVNLEGMDTMRNFYAQGGDPAIKVLSNVGSYKVALRLLGGIPQWEDAFERYADIAEIIESIETMFGSEAIRVADGTYELPSDDFINYQFMLERGVRETIIEANNRIMELLDQFHQDLIKIDQALQAQEELLYIVKLLEGFYRGDIENVSSQHLGTNTKETLFEFNNGTSTRNVRLIQRAREDGYGQASIRFTVDPKSRYEISFRIDRNFNQDLNQYIVTVDIESPALSRAYRLGGYKEKHHFQLAVESQLTLANKNIFYWLVKIFY